MNNRKAGSIHDRVLRTMNDVSPEKLTLTLFQSACQTRFRVQTAPDRTVEMRLIEVSESPGEMMGEKIESFSILFKGPLDPFLPQRMYSIEHDAIGRFDLFMVPVGKVPDGFQYQAVFNRRPVAS